MICMKFCRFVEFIFRSVSKSPKLRFIENKDDQMTLVRMDLRNTNQQINNNYSLIIHICCNVLV